MNLPIAVWMQFSLAGVPEEILGAAPVDGAGLLRSLWSIILPIITPRSAATGLIGLISSQGLFLARSFAVSTIASLPVLIAGFAARDKLVRGLSLGAVT